MAAGTAWAAGPPDNMVPLAGTSKIITLILKNREADFE